MECPFDAVSEWSREAIHIAVREQTENVGQPSLLISSSEVPLMERRYFHMSGGLLVEQFSPA